MPSEYKILMDQRGLPEDYLSDDVATQHGHQLGGRHNTSEAKRATKGSKSKRFNKIDNSYRIGRAYLYKMLRFCLYKWEAYLEKTG